MHALLFIALLADPVVTMTAPDRTWVDVRAGVASGDATGQHESICLEASPFAFLALEGCGNGAGVLHESETTEIAHFRTKWRLASFRRDRAWVVPRLAVGFAELQVGEDASGFDFSGTGPRGVETAGPEAGLSVQMVVPIGGGFEMIGDLTAGAAWMPHAPDLVTPADPWQLSAGFTAGIGF